MFSMKITNYKSTHGGVQIPSFQYHHIERDEVPLAKLVLPEVYQKQCSFNSIKVALAWMANLLEGVNSSDES